MPLSIHGICWRLFCLPNGHRPTYGLLAFGRRLAAPQSQSHELAIAWTYHVGQRHTREGTPNDPVHTSPVGVNAALTHVLARVALRRALTAIRQCERPLDGVDDLSQRDLSCRTTQPIAALSAPLRLHHALSNQALQNLLHCRQGQTRLFRGRPCRETRRSPAGGCAQEDNGVIG